MITTREAINQPISLIGSQYALPNASPLSPDDYRDLVKRRAVSILHLTPDEHDWENNEELRRETEALIMEKINKESNFLPIDFLSKGVEIAKAICRIVTPSGFGTGFLIDKGILMTNHHVIKSADDAKNCFAEFGYEENQTPIKVKIKPGDLFITSPFEELDFTIVGCEASKDIDGIVPIKLLRSPTTITRGEYANIIQHPNGRKKEVALQDNTVSYVYDKVIHYTTDTQEGSSGAAVLNNQWQLVALHHAGWEDKVKQSASLNEGIRISAIVSKLVALAQAGNPGALRLTQSLEGTSPYLGFYDVEGLITNPDDFAEIEIPTFKGDKRFADIGFWNIENFNNNVAEQRVKDVAQVVADMSMDTLGLVEVEKDALEQLVNALKDRGAAMDYVYLEAEGAQDLAVLFDTTTTKVELKDDINHRYSQLLRSTVNGKPAFPNKREPLFALCTVKEDNKDIQFLMIVVHLKAMRDPISTQRRTAAAETLSVIIEDLKQDDKYKHLPIVLGGDLNDDAGSSSLASVMNSPSVITLTTDDALAGHISYLKPPCSLIDHIIITKDMKIGSIQSGDQMDDAAIVRLDKTITDFAKTISDHAPLVLRVIYKDEHPGQEQPRAGAAPIQLANDNTLEKTLLRLNLNRFKLEEDQPYYDAEKDKLNIVNYYNSIQMQGTSPQLFQQLHRLLLSTHTTIFTYKQSRNHLYSEVDLQEDRTLHSIYSDNKLDPEMLIQEDFRMEQLREGFWKNKEAYQRMAEEDIEEMLGEKIQFNTEHVVPQSWFKKKSPMVSDLHHLFTCDTDCNSFRSNIPYYDFVDYNTEAYREQIRNECGKRGGNIRFEPESGKGKVARAVLYFLLRYPGKLGKEMVNSELLLNWHKEHPVTLHERHRNRAIYELQGNRNPLIDFPELAERIDFTLIV